jgi:hypothetical protein
MPALLVITDISYSLLLEQDRAWNELALLPGGARSLIPRADLVHEAGLERAIEMAENWLMPHAARLRGQVLEVTDATGRLATGLRELLTVAPAAWSVDDVEALFLRIVDLTTGRSPLAAALKHPFFVADMLLLRELAHHGQLAGISLRFASDRVERRVEDR